MSLDQALKMTLALGDAEGCGTGFGIVPPPSANPAQQAHDEYLVVLREANQLGPQLTAICGSSAVASAAALGGSLGSLQTTKTVSQFRLTRRRIDSRSSRPSKRFGLNGSTMLAKLDTPSRLTLTDASDLELTQSGFGVYTQAEYERRDRTTTALEAGYEARISSGLAGFDYAMPNGLLAGAWVGYSNKGGDYTGVNLLDGGTDLSDICNLSAGGGFNDVGVKLGSFVGGRFGRGFVDVAAQYSNRDHDYERNVCAIETSSAVSLIEANANSPSGFSSDGVPIDDIYAGTLSGQTTLTEWSVSVRSGYDFGDERLLWGPRVSITYVKSKIDAFTENGQTSVTNTVNSNPNNAPIITTKRNPGDPTGLELAFDDQSRTSLQTEAQFVAAYRFEQKFGTLIPRASASWLHEFKGEREQVTVRMAQDFRGSGAKLIRFTTDSADKNKGVIAVGVTALLNAQFAADIEVAHLVADDNFDATTFTAQARWRF